MILCYLGEVITIFGESKISHESEVLEKWLRTSKMRFQEKSQYYVKEWLKILSM